MEDSPFPNGCIQIYEQHTFIHDKELNEVGTPMCLTFMKCTSHKVPFDESLSNACLHRLMLNLVIEGEETEQEIHVPVFLLH